MRATYRFDQRGAFGKGPAPAPAQGASVPAPIEGWDAVSPIAVMSPKRAVKLDNWFPQPGWIEIRKGHVIHAPTNSLVPVETLAAYQGVSSTKLFAASGTKIYDATAASTATASVTGLANARWQHINFATSGGHFLYMVNGADTPRYYDGSSWAAATITGVTSSAIIGVNAHKNRLWFTVASSSTAAYLPTDSIQGAASLFPLGGLFTMGGYLMAIGTWSVDAGNGPDDYLVFVSSRGQAAIYSGTDPSSTSTWSLVGVFNMGAPIGRRCLTRVGSDVAIITLDGVVPLSKVMIFERAAIPKTALTERIQRVMNQSARDYGANFGWQLISYPRGTRAILNVPVSENVTQYQYVMNTLSGAWCRFLGMNFSCWELYNDKLYGGGNDGIVYEADKTGTDSGEVLTCDMMTSFNYYNSRGSQKRWMQCRPLLTTDSQVEPGLAFNVDFRTDAPISTPSTTSQTESLWDVAKWDVDYFAGEVTTLANWTSVTGIGYCSSIRMTVDLTYPNIGLGAQWGIGLWGINSWSEGQGREVILQVNGFDLTYEKGAFI